MIFINDYDQFMISFYDIIFDFLLSYAVHPDPPSFLLFLLLGISPCFLLTFRHFRIHAYFLGFFLPIFDIFIRGCNFSNNKVNIADYGLEEIINSIRPYILEFLREAR